MANLFCIRANNGEYTDAFLNGGYAAIGWLPENNLVEIGSKKDLYQIYRKVYPNDNNYTTGQNVGQIARFLFEIKEGDFVFTIGKANRVYVGKVEERYPYFYSDKKDECLYRHRVSVQWFKEPLNLFIPIEGQNISLKQITKNLKSRLTVFKIKKIDVYSYLNFALNMLRKVETLKRSINSNGVSEISFNMVRGEERVQSEDYARLEKNIFNTYNLLDIQYCRINLINLSLVDEITLFYSTTRNKADIDNNEFYGGDFESDDSIILKQGICKVSIPKSHRKGKLERPLNLILYKQSESKSSHISLVNVFELSIEDFNEFVSKTVNETEEKSALIFIHGFNTSFAEAAQRAAQLTYDIPFNNNISGFFSWPSSSGLAKKAAYLKDADRVDACFEVFADFIENLIDKCSVKKLHFIAHSMGSKLLTEGLIILSKRQSFKNNINSISQIILAAPDIDQTVFKNRILPHFKAIGINRTIYTSKYDKALIVSRLLRKGLTKSNRFYRLGKGGEQSIFVSAGIETIDASLIESGLNNYLKALHDYVFEYKEILNDLYYVLNKGLSARHRALIQDIKNNLPYYKFAK